MSTYFDLEIVTSTDTTLTVKIKDLYIPAYYGKAGILTNHLPYISLLKFGELAYKDIEDQIHYLVVREGFIEVLKEKIVIITESFERGEELVESKLSDELSEIKARIKTSTTGEITAEELKHALVEHEKIKVKYNIVKKIKAAS